jgi:hypothetical protein
MCRSSFAMVSRNSDLSPWRRLGVAVLLQYTVMVHNRAWSDLDGSVSASSAGNCHAYTPIPLNSHTTTTTPSAAASTAETLVLESATATATLLSPSVSKFPSILPQQTAPASTFETIYESIQSEYQHELDHGFRTFGQRLDTLKIENTPNSTISTDSILDVSFERERFPTSTSKTANNETQVKDVTFSVPVGTAGPEEFNPLLRNTNIIHQTQHKPWVSVLECDALIQEAKEVLLLQSKNAVPSNHATTATSFEGQNSSTTATITTATTTATNYELGEVRVSQLPRTRQWLQQVLQTRFFPLLSSQYGIPIEDLTLQDGLIIGYGYRPTLSQQDQQQQQDVGSRAQPIHRDSCLLSINIALSSLLDYSDGGTYFEGIQVAVSRATTAAATAVTTDNSSPRLYDGGTIKTDRGHLTCHPGGIPHAGRIIGPNGQRWVLVLFCIARNVPELARRCHAQGMRLQQGQQHDGVSIEQAKAMYQAGLLLAPTDHLLLTSLGRIYIDHEQNEIVARNCLALAAQGYNQCMKANLALGRMMLSNRRPRGALRRFDRVLAWLQDRDVIDDNENGVIWEPYRSMGYDARYYGAQAAIISAREAKRRQDNNCSFDWRHHVTIAIQRCHIALLSTPDDTRLHGMLSFAENLLNEESNA